MIDIEVYTKEDGTEPFAIWLKALRDKTVKARILREIEKLHNGVPSKSKPIKSGVHELKLTFGSGWRIYFGNDGDSLVILLTGSTKRDQSKQIERAMEYWSDYKTRKKTLAMKGRNNETKRR